LAQRILLVNPPVYDFSAYDFWLKPYGLLTIAGFLRGKAELLLFDYLDRMHPAVPKDQKLRSDQWGKGEYYSRRIDKPDCFLQIPRYYRRFGLPRKEFEDFLSKQNDFDWVLIQTGMTYWYPGVIETIEVIKKFCPKVKIVLGGIYATLCPEHAKSLGADLVVEDSNLDELWKLLNLSPDFEQPPFWEGYQCLPVVVLKLTDGCPFRCTYCAVHKFYREFRPRPLERSLRELEFLTARGAGNVAFYDDALLYKSQEILVPFLREVIRRKVRVNFHTPNALHARYISYPAAELMLEAGFKSFYLGFESRCEQWHQKTGPKVSSAELAEAVRILLRAGARPEQITAYQILGHPDSAWQDIEASMRFAHSLGIRVMLADFSPVPHTPDGQACRRWVNVDEPLWHNKTAFPIVLLGEKEVNRLKDLTRRGNRQLGRRRQDIEQPSPRRTKGD